MVTINIAIGAERRTFTGKEQQLANDIINSFPGGMWRKNAGACGGDASAVDWCRGLIVD